MKTNLSLIIASLALAAAVYASLPKNGDHVTQKEFRAAHGEVLAQFDSVKTQVKELRTEVLLRFDSLQIEVFEINQNLDTLKAGQSIIYKDMQKPRESGKGLGDLIQEFFN